MFWLAVALMVFPELLPTRWETN
jgi:hypothetical protein